MPDKNKMQMVVQPVAQGEVAGPLDAHYYKGPGSRQGGEREYVAQAIAFAAPAIGTFSETQVAGTLMKHNGAGSGETQNCAYVAFDTYNYATSDVSQTIKSPAGEANESVGTVMQAMAVRRLTTVDVDHKHDTLQQGGINHANAEEAGPREVLRALHEALGEEAFAEWGLGVLASFFPQKVLRQAVHGLGLRCQTIEEFGLVYYALSREEDRTERAVLQVRSFASNGRTPQGWGPHEQRPRELGAYLSQLSQPRASTESVMQDLWQASEGLGVLRQALSAVQEVGRSPCSEEKPAHAAFAVRRLVPEECEFLQGFPRNYTRIPWKKKSAEECPDGGRYKALGNSMACNVMRWLGRRIELVEACDAR